MDRASIARELRRQQAEDALELEDQREEALRGRREQVIVELDGWRVDQAVLPAMTPEDVSSMRNGDLLAAKPDEWQQHELEEELLELDQELRGVEHRRTAIRRYLEALLSAPAELPEELAQRDTVG
jgi:hypothetical protein